MKQKKDISLELKNELNLIRDTYIAVIENRTRPFTVDDIRNGIKPYQIVGLSEVPDLLSDSDEDIEKFVDEWFDKVFNFDGKPRTPLTPEQQSLIIDELDRATIEAILIHRQRDAAQSRGKNDLNEFIEYQLRALYDLYEENPPTSTNGKRRTYGEKKYTQNKLFYMVYDKLREEGFLPVGLPAEKKQSEYDEKILKRIKRIADKINVNSIWFVDVADK